MLIIISSLTYTGELEFQTIIISLDTQAWLLTTLVDGEYTDNVSRLTVRRKSETAFGVLCEIGKNLVEMGQLYLP